MKSVQKVEKYATRKCGFSDTSVADLSKNAAKMTFTSVFWKNIAKELIFSH